VWSTLLSTELRRLSLLTPIVTEVKKSDGDGGRPGVAQAVQRATSSADRAMATLYGAADRSGLRAASAGLEIALESSAIEARSAS
jgi:hypothetical protein